MSYIVVTSARDRAASGRSIASALSGVVVGIGLLIVRPGMGIPVPITGPPAGPAPVAIPSGGHPGGGGHLLVVAADADGSCYVDGARVNGATFNHMLLDTGDGGYLAFGRNMAERLGFDPDKLDYSYSYDSANGVGHEAVVKVREFRLGGFVLRDVPAVISKVNQDVAIVGVETLHRLGLRLSDGHCELRLPS